METERKKERVKELLQKGILVTPDLLEDDTQHQSSESASGTVTVLADAEAPQKPSTIDQQATPVRIVSVYQEKTKKRTMQDFVAYFNARYQAIEKMLRNRLELQNLTSITRLKQKKDRETLSLIGMVRDKHTTSKGGIMLTVEDPSGWIKVYVNKNNQELFKAAKDIVLDEVLGILGVNGDNILFANKIVWPDIPLSKELKKAPEEGYALFLSDLHVGSDHFLPKEFNQMLEWINGKVGNEEQRAIAQKIKYIIIAGDLVDGLGIYPGQEQELLIIDIKEQYRECARLLRKIPPPHPDHHQPWQPRCHAPGRTPARTL